MKKLVYRLLRLLRREPEEVKEIPHPDVIHAYTVPIRGNCFNWDDRG